MNFLNQRRTTAFALLLTALLLALNWTIPYPQREWLEIDYDLFPQTVRMIYLVMLAVVAVAFVFEPLLRRELRESGSLPLLVGVALLIAVGFGALISQQDQGGRFARAVPSLSLLALYAAVIISLLIFLSLDEPFAALTSRFRRYTLIALLIIGTLLLALHIISTGRYGLFNDVYDEIWAASSMANYALNGDFAPSLGGSPYGIPDPLFARWLLYNGMWAKLWGSTDFVTLRSFPTFAGVVLMLIVGAILWRVPSLSLESRLAGIVFLLAMSVYARTAHNLRMDIGLGVYGALVLFCWLEYVRDEQHAVRWLLPMGLLFYLGLETIPTVALFFAFSIGLAVVWRSFRMPITQTRWMHILAYLIGCVLASGLYIWVHFLPDFATRWENFNIARQRYVYMGSTRTGLPFLPLRQIHLFSLVMSPVEVIGIYGGIIWLLWRGTRDERQLMGAVAFTQLLIATLLGGSFGYQMIFGAIVAYAVARAFTGRAVVAVTTFVIIPAMASVMLFDMVDAWRWNENGRTIAELDLLTWRVPDGATVVSDDLFWITLHEKANVIGHSALQHYMGAHNLNPSQALAHLNADMVICRTDVEDQARLCTMADDYFDSPPEEFMITSGTYQVYGP